MTTQTNLNTMCTVVVRRSLPSTTRDVSLTPHALLCNMISDTLRIGSHISTAVIVTIESPADYALLSSEDTLDWLRSKLASSSEYGPVLVKAEAGTITTLHGEVVHDLQAIGEVVDFSVVGSRVIAKLELKLAAEEAAS